ncbi:MAG TPA: MYXO-CTERM sorting domain-containing protein [Polyangiaceae bacterium]|nr:MYXO-CTERM sorting domain-containing protein [Polyangiaceae bacterium]
MRKSLASFASLGALAATVVAQSASAATLMVGPGQTYTTPCAAIAAAAPGDEIDIASGTYNDSCNISTAGLHLKGVGATRPKIDVTGQTLSNMKGIYAIEADDVIVENLELMGAAIPSGQGENGAGLRIQSNGVVVTNCYIHDNQTGILSGPITAGTGTQTIDHTEFANNSLGNGCTDGNGCTHNLYIGHYAKLIFQFNWTHMAGSDGGHLLKSRALESDILYNRITGETGDDSFEVDLPNGGVGILVGNEIEKGPNSGNKGTVVNYGEEGLGTGTNTLYLANNTLVNDSGDANTVFVSIATGGMLGAAHDNIFYGGGTPSSTGMLSADNMNGVDPMFVNAAMYDYHLKMGSPAIGKGVAQGSAGSFPLTPVFEYFDPVSAVARLTAKDLGAFEYGTPTGNPSMDAGAVSPDGAVSGSSSGGGSSGGDGGGSSSGGSGGSGSSGGTGSGSSGGGSSSSGGGSSEDGGSNGATSGNGGGCGCSTVGSGRGASFGMLGFALGLALVVARRRRASRGNP